MKKIASEVYIESAYPGVLVAAVVLPRGTLLIDAPLQPEDGHAWLAALRGKGASSNRLLVSLDSHPDRTIGARALNAPIIAHSASASRFRSRASMFKAQNETTGSAWESIPGLTGLRWLPPAVSFSSSAGISFDDKLIQLEHHPGPEDGSLWVHLPEHKLLFVGDCVPVNQPPFLAFADINAWLDDLERLLSPAFSGYTILSSRGGEVSAAHIRDLRRLLKDIKGRLDRLAQRKSHPSATDKVAANLLSKYKLAAKPDDPFAQRLRYGLHQNYTRRFRSAPKTAS